MAYLVKASIRFLLGDPGLIPGMGGLIFSFVSLPPLGNGDKFRNFVDEFKFAFPNEYFSLLIPFFYSLKTETKQGKQFLHILFTKITNFYSH